MDKMTEMMQPEVRMSAPMVVVAAATAQHETAYRTAYDLMLQRAPREALQAIEPALAEDPKNRGLRSLRAWAYFMRAQLQKATDELSGLLTDDPTDLWVRHTLGRALERQGNYAEALPHLRLAAAMSGDPEHEYDVLRVERLAGTVR